MTNENSNTKNFAVRIGRFSNKCVVILLKGIALLPFGVLYLLSDVIYFLLKNFIRYRNTVILENLQTAFPEKAGEEILHLRNGFYRHLSDVFLESVKLHYMTPRQMQKRVHFKGVDEMNRFAEAGRGVIVLAYHHNNWEWGSFLQTQSKHQILMVYNKMRDNQAMDDFLLYSREKWGGRAVQMGRAAKVAFDEFNKRVPSLLWLVADQSALAEQGTWTMFLNREAAFFTGPEKIARHTNQPVFFQTVKKLGRGKYEYEFSLMVEEPAKAAPNEILLTYISKMEEAIHTAPEYYLWSHRRWKHKRPEGTELIPNLSRNEP
ncbi:MAG: lysophospholipid acyltransferase family protein [Draconibacterium sp.]